MDSSSHSISPRAFDNRQRAEAAWAALHRHFYVGDGLFREQIPVLERGMAYSYNWPFGAVWTSALSVAALEGAAGEGARQALADLRRGARAYWDDQPGKVPGYASYVVSLGGGDRFYDDNIWMGCNHVRDSHLGGGDTALRWAEETWNFVWSGWDDKLGGGIYWRERDRASKNACCSGPASVLALMLYEETGKADYLHQGRELYAWTREVLCDPADGLYWDNIRASDGRIERTKWSYNTGTPISAGVLLHRHTGDATYLEQARASADAAQRRFAPDGIYAGSVWFHSVLFRGLVQLYGVTGHGDLLEAIQRSVDSAWEVARDERGLIYPDWGQGKGLGGVLKLLDAAPFAEAAALLVTLDGR